MKKLLIYIIILAITLIMAINFFVFYSNSSVSGTLTTSDDIRTTITELDNFKTTITEMSDSQEIFILTGNSKYKDDYQTNLNNAYANSTTLVEQGIISTESV